LIIRYQNRDSPRTSAACTASQNRYLHEINQNEKYIREIPLESSQTIQLIKFNHLMHPVTSRYQLLYTQRRISLNPHSTSHSSVTITFSARPIVEKMTISPINSRSSFENSAHGTACPSLRIVRATAKFGSVARMRKLTSMWDSR